MDDVVVLLAKKPDQVEKAVEIPQGPDFPADHIQIHKAESMLRNRLLKSGVGSEDVSLPAFRSRHAAQSENDCGGAAKARFADNVENPDTAFVFTNRHDW
jgi:hypothetical protein